jgi:hypothetical protein
MRAEQKRALEALLPDGSVGVIGRTFDLMAVAEREIARARRKHRTRRTSELLNGSFLMLQPGELSRYSDELYAAHCRELLERVVKGDDPRPGTRAEMLAALSEASLKAPLERNAHTAMEHLFAQCFPGNALSAGGHSPGEQWPGAVAELLRGMARRLAKDDRGPARRSAK